MNFYRYIENCVLKIHKDSCEKIENNHSALQVVNMFENENKENIKEENLAKNTNLKNIKYQFSN